MKHFHLKLLLIAIICGASIPAAYAADTITATESLTDSLKSSKTDGVTTYYVETSGTFSVTAKISGDTFYDAGIFLTDITKNSTIEISIGDYSFSSTLAEASPLTLTTAKIAAKWTAYHDGACKDANCTEYKQVKDTTVSIASGLNGITLKIDGTSKKIGDSLLYGSRVFADLCDTAGDNAVETSDASLTINGTPLVATVQFNCSVKTRTQIKGGEPYALVTTKVLKTKRIQ